VECRSLLRKDGRVEADLLTINEANITAENVQYYNIKVFTTHTLFKEIQIASGMLDTVKKNLKSKFKII
jgi:hypothetical protein